jgi:DNA-binding winged helix-turn-helix (wHTH) protein
MTDLIYAFGPFCFDTRQMLLWRDETPVPLGRRATVILAALLGARGQVVGKDTLIDAAWPGAAIEESNLSVQVSKLRRAIGEARIRTVERVGYQFVAAPAATLSRAVSSHDAFPSIALAATEPGHMQALLVNVSASLSRFKSLRVMGDELKQLATNYLVKLSPGRSGDGDATALTVSLLECETGMVLWADRFAAGAEGWLEDRIAAAVESAVQAAEMVRGPRGVGPAAEAYGLYLRGRRTLNSSRAVDNRVAFALFMAAIELEPENAAYLGAAAEAMHHRLAVGWEPLGDDDKQICRELAYRTLAVAGSDAVAIGLVGNALFTADEEDMGLALCRRALRMNPTSQLVLACAFHAEGWGGTLENKDRLARVAIGLAPDDPAQRFALGAMATVASWHEDHHAALDWARRSLAVGPGYVGGHHGIIAALVQLGRQEEAEQQVGRYLAMSPGVTLMSIERGQHHADRSRLAPRLEALRRAGVPAR